MRINELAKSIGQRFSTDVKSADIMEEIASNEAFADLRGKVKSHSSAIDDRAATVMFQIFEQRSGGSAAAKPTATAVAAAPVVTKAAPPKPQAAIAPKPNALAPRPAGSRPAPRPPSSVPPPSPLRAATGAPLPTLAPARTIVPPRPQPLAPAARVPGPVTPPRPVQLKPAAPVATQPAPAAPAATDKPAAPAPAPAGTPATQSGARAAQPAAEEKRPAAPAASDKANAPAASATAPAVAPASEGAPRTAQARPAAPPRLGQPAAPKMPKFSMDSPFVSRPKPAPRPEASRPGAPAGRDDRGRPPLPGRRDSGGGGRPVNLQEIGKLPEIGVMKLKPAGAPGGGKRHREDKAERDKRIKGEKLAAKKKLLRPTKVYGDADEFRRPLKGAVPVKGVQSLMPKEKGPVVPDGPVILTEPLTVAEFAEKLGITAGELIKSAFMKGKGITINQLIDFDLAEELAFDRNIDISIQLAGDETDIAQFRPEDKPEDFVSRPPVVTIMGHVDHGKTTVLDYYRKSNVVSGEHGGITQHIGAYHVSSSRGDIVFLDTPGHAAFTAMRARGAQVTDIVVLVVAADDSVMPQTIEAVNHAKAAEVPIIVAINKCDLPDAQPDKVRNELMQYGVLSTQLGGETEFVEISAKVGTGMDNLLEMISLQAEVMELKGNPNTRAEGIVIESHVDSLRGSVATVLIERGTLRVSDVFVVGQQTGRVRAMRNDTGQLIRESMLCQPIEVIGLTGTPEVGEVFLVMESERKAREIASVRESRRRLLDLGTTRHVSIEGLQDRVDEGEVKDFNIILKADVQGSVEAIIQALGKLNTTEVRARILHSGTGGITESDVSLAMASGATIVGFGIRPEAAAAAEAEREGVDIKLYNIIYELIEDIEGSMLGLHEKKFKEATLSRSQVREVFKVSRIGTIAGCMVLSGDVSRNEKARLVRDSVVVYTGRIASLRRVKEDVAKVASGFECGIMLEKFQDIKQNDIIETYHMEELPLEVTRLETASKR